MLIRFLLRIAAMFWLGLTAYAQAEKVDERILLTFIPNVQFAPFYVGIESGYFADAGFNVSLEHLQEPEVLDLVAVGQANYGIVSGEQVILARSRGRDVVYVFEWFQQYPVGLVHNRALDLSDLDDLRRMTIGIPGRFGASYSGLTTLLGSAGLSEDDINLREIGFNAPEVFCLGAVDAAIVYVNNEPLQIQHLASKGDCGAVSAVDVVTVSSQVDLVSNGLIVSGAYLEDAPDAVERMTRSLGDALRTAINNPAYAYLASLKHVDSLPADESLVSALEAAADGQVEFLASDPDRDAIAKSRQQLEADLTERFDGAMLTQFRVLLNTIELWDAEYLGYSDLASWKAMRDTLESLGYLENEAGDLRDAFTNQFIAGRDE
ncbi:MAG: ABC transporter substrate-binding protein [Chloroflexota bacterium]|nr:ABC transporter substrate-binding protein [Chloroflexota bacterium]MDE2909756.1 ABC transporter substrate-binding protein [Chloroflexota bacterium]